MSRYIDPRRAREMEEERKELRRRYAMAALTGILADNVSRYYGWTAADMAFEQADRMLKAEDGGCMLDEEEDE